MGKYKFISASLLSAIASVVFAAFILAGLVLLFNDFSSSDWVPLLGGVQIAFVRAVGGAAILFGMCGLPVPQDVPELVISIAGDNRFNHTGGITP